ETIITVTVVTLIFRDPFVLVVARCECAAIGVLHVVDHRTHHVAAGAPAHFMHALERVIVGDEHRSRRQYDQRDKSNHLCSRLGWQSCDQERNGRSVFKLAESRASRANAKQDTQHAKQRTEKIDEMNVVDAHVATFRTETAVTLNSGSL